MNDRDCDNCAHHSEGGCSVWECSFEAKEDDTISRRAAIDAMEGVDWYHINKDGQLTHGANSEEDEPLYKAEDVYKVLNDMPSVPQNLQPTCNQLATDTISRQAACEYCHEDSDGYVMPLEKNCHAFIRFGMDGWELSLKANGWHGGAKIRYCPMCGRDLLVK